MMEKLKRRTNHFLWGSLIFLALLCVCVFYWITSTMVTESKNTISEVANIYMEEISKQYQNHFDTLVNLRYQQINAIIEAFPPEEVETHLSSLRSILFPIKTTFGMIEQFVTRPLCHDSIALKES